MTEECVSIILPVYNEEGNIAACLRGLTESLKDVPHEILVCYDFDEDTTLPAISRMEGKPATVTLVRNTPGKGAAAAIRAGFQSARGDVRIVIGDATGRTLPRDRRPERSGSRRSTRSL